MLLVVTAACSPRAVTPPARTLGMDSPIGPAVGKFDAQLDLGAIGQTFGPELVGGNARVRHAVRPGLVAEVDGGMLHVQNEGSGGDRSAYTGRIGAMVHDADQRVALTFGIGGGTSRTAGSWGAADVGFVVTGKQQTVRPVFAMELGYAAPFDESRTFDVAEPGGDITTLRLPNNTIGKITAGLDIGQDSVKLLLGVSIIKFWLRESSIVSSDFENTEESDPFVTVGAGLRIAID